MLGAHIPEATYRPFWSGYAHLAYIRFEKESPKGHGITRRRNHPSLFIQM